MKPNFDTEMGEEAFLRAKLATKYVSVEQMVGFCRECRKFIRRASRRSLINGIDYSCILHVRRNLYVAERILFEELVVVEQCLTTVYEALSRPVVRIDIWGYTISAYGKPVVTKRFKNAPANPLLFQNRIDRLRNDASRLQEELLDGYY